MKFVDHPNCQNAATDVTAITFDSVGPVVSINAVSCNSSHYASSATPTFEISATDNTASVASVHWEIKQGTTLIEASNVTVSPATYATTVTVHPTVALSNDVEYTFYATATDGIGNVCTPATYGFWVYAETANTAEATSGEFTKDNQAVVNFSEPVWVVHPASFAFTSPAAATGISVEAATTSGVYAKQVTLTLSGLTAEIQTNGATLSISQAAVETVAGYNLAATQPTVFISGDTTRPQVTSIDINPSLASATTVTFTFVFNEKMATSVTPTVKYGTTTPDQPATPGSWNTGATAWTATATFGPGDTGNYQVEISGAKDRANNEIISATSNFTVVSDPATITITGPTVPATTKTPQFTVVAQQVNPVTIVSVTYDISGPTVLTGQTVVASPNATYVTSTFTVSQALSDGNYVMTVTATDSLGNVGTQQYSFEVEATLNITHAEFTTDKDVTILFDKTIQDIDAAYVVASGATTTVSGSQATISGNTVYVTLQSSVPVTWQTAQSPATIKVIAGHVTDTYGYTPASDTTCTISADTTNPSIISVDVSPATAITATQVTITAAFNEKMSTSGVTVKIGTTNVTTFSWNGTYTQLVAKQWMSQEGNYSILVEAQDRASNPCSDSSKTFILDKTAPGVSFTAKPDSLTNDNTPQFTVSASDATSNVTSVEYQVDSGSWTSVSITAATSVTATFTTSALADGSHTIKARATDQLGNVTASANYATYTFTVDTTGPAVSFTAKPSTPTSDSTPSFTVKATDSITVSSVEYQVDTGSWTSLTITPATSVTASFTTSALSDGSHTVKAKATDYLGNTGSAATYTFTVDTTAPQVSTVTVSPSPVPTPTNPVTVTITVEFNESMSSATPTVTFGKVSPYDAYSVSGTWVDNTQWQGTYSITSGVETGKYYISISDAKDLAGNKMATDATTTFTITPLSEKKETVGKSGGTVDLGDGTKVEIPAGALDIDTEIVIKRQPDYTPAFENTTYLTATGIVREFGPAGLVFNKDVTIVIPYDEDELPAGVDEEDLHLYFWDGANWQPVGNEVVDTVNNTITVTVNHFTIFQAVGDTTPASALQFKVYLTKNPFLRGGSTTFVFTLPKKGNVTLKIYDTSGDLVRTLIDNELYNAGKASKVWDGDNDFGNYVGTGLYLYRFEVKYTAGGSDKQIKLVGVVK